LTVSTPAQVWQAGADWRQIDIVSDIHLHAGAPHTFGAWRTHLLETSADAVLILGDLFDVWVGDDALTGTFEAECAAVLRAASARRQVFFMHGNRDFLVGASWSSHTGVTLLPDPTLGIAWGQRVLLSHGDSLCIADQSYQRFRAMVRPEAWQAEFLELPLDERRRKGWEMRQASMLHQAQAKEQGGTDVDDALANQWLDEAKAAVLLHGHTHRPGCVGLGGDRVRWVLGDWELDAQPTRALGMRWTPEGLSPLDLSGL